MIIDNETNTVFLSDKLKVNFPDFCNEFTGLLLNEGITIKQINKTADIWCRDYMPVQVDDNKFVQFIYDPTYLINYEHLKTNTQKLHLPFRCMRSEIKLDGGNIVRWKNKIIVTDKIFSENNLISKEQVISDLINQLELEEVIVIPHQPYDYTGHSDSMVRFLDEFTVLLNDFYLETKTYKNTLYKILKNHKIESIPFPYYYPEKDNGNADSAEGCYINYLNTGNLIVLPIFNVEKDNEAIKTIESLFPDYTIRSVVSNEIAKEGGLLNCITSNIKL